MSKVTIIYDALLTELALLFPTKKVIVDPYEIEENKIQFLRDSYGIKFIGETNQFNEFHTMGKTLQFSVIISKEFIKLENATVDNIVKGILEEINTLRLRLFKYDQLEIHNEIDSIELGATGELVSVYSGKDNIKYIETFFDINCRENL